MTAAIVAVVLMFLTWLISLPLRDVSIVDIVWGLDFVLIGLVTYLRFAPPDDRRWATVVLVMVTVWGVRLAAYIGRRKRDHGEDYRYRSMREKRPETFSRGSLVTVFLLQAGLMWVVSLPLQTSIAFPLAGDVTGFGLWVGLPIYSVGLFFEAVGDWQLARFKANPDNNGKVMDRGLWRFTRHPNYFGDFCVWWGIFTLAFDGGHWWTIVGPLAMTALLMKISGAALLERTIGRRRPDYDDYADRTNAFFPGPPKKA